MFSNEKRWKSLWAKETRPKHSIDNEAFYQSYSKELLVLIGDTPPARVLEIGCGTGALYPYLNFEHCSRYIGVDVSDSMLCEFKNRYPGVELVKTDGETYADKNEYDLIFSNSVIQNFTHAMLDAHLERSADMLAPGGRIIAAMIPWRPARYAYADGSLMQSQNPGLLRYAKIRAAMWKEGFMGRWYDHRELAELARKYGLTVKFHGSLHYPYRIHAVFKRRT